MGLHRDLPRGWTPGRKSSHVRRTPTGPRGKQRVSPDRPVLLFDLSLAHVLCMARARGTFTFSSAVSCLVVLVLYHWTYPVRHRRRKSHRDSCAPVPGSSVSDRSEERR